MAPLLLHKIWIITLKINKALKIRALFIRRRERDSNPRTFDSQRFSRPPHSTALPSLRVQNNSAEVYLPKKNAENSKKTFLSM